MLFACAQRRGYSVGGICKLLNPGSNNTGSSAIRDYVISDDPRPETLKRWCLVLGFEDEFTVTVLLNKMSPEDDRRLRYLVPPMEPRDEPIFQLEYLRHAYLADIGLLSEELFFEEYIQRGRRFSSTSPEHSAPWAICCRHPHKTKDRIHEMCYRIEMPLTDAFVRIFNDITCGPYRETRDTRIRRGAFEALALDTVPQEVKIERRFAAWQKSHLRATLKRLLRKLDNDTVILDIGDDFDPLDDFSLPLAGTSARS
jgi:hypothetical protein